MVIDTKGMVDTEHGMLDRRIYTDQEVYQQELEKIFGRAWLCIGHESLVPNPNDFFLTYMGEDPVILTRDAQGELHAFLNMCRHRGNRVVRADDGNAKNFMCTYHGWTYSSEGKLVSVPGLQEAYYGELDVDNLGLVSVAQIDSYAGMVFATWDPGAPSLEDYLGDMRYYMDSMFNKREGGVELVGPDKWVIPCNWKFPADNFAGDGYHFPLTHRSALLARMQRFGQKLPDASYKRGDGFGISPGNGHGLFGRMPELAGVATGQPVGNASLHPVLGEYYRETREEVTRRLGDLRANRFAGVNGSIFPNLSFLWVNGTVRVWHPRGPGKIEVWSFVAIDKAAPDKVRDAVWVMSMQSFGSAGIVEQDDIDNWAQCTAAGRSPMGRRFPVNVAMAMGRETTDELLPGRLAPHDINEGPQQSLYARWQEMMDAESWEQISVTPAIAKYEGTATFKG